MKLRTLMLMSALLALPALSSASDPAEANPATTKTAFDLKAAKVQDVIRSHAAAQPAAEKAEPGESAPTELEPLPFRAPRRVHAAPVGKRMRALHPLQLTRQDPGAGSGRAVDPRSRRGLIPAFARDRA